MISPLKSPQLDFRFPSFIATDQRTFFSHGYVGKINGNHRKTWTRHSMFLSTKPALKDGTLSFNGSDALTNVPDNVVVTPFTNSSAFVGATSKDASSRHVFKLGVIRYFTFF